MADVKIYSSDFVGPLPVNAVYENRTTVVITDQIDKDIADLDLRSKIQAVDNFISSGHDATAFIYFKVNQFVLDTRQPNTFKHYAISLENKKTGVGSGNQFTLKIAYHKDFSDMKSANLLEDALSNLRNTSLFVDNRGYVKELTKNECLLEYGYLDEARIRSTGQYKGMLLKYSMNVNKQIIEYTLEGYSGEQADIGVVNWYPKIKQTELQNGEQVATDLISEAESAMLRNNKEEIKRLIKEFNKVYTGPVKIGPFKALDYFLQDYNHSIDLMNSVSPDSSKAAKFKIQDLTGRDLMHNSVLKPVTLSLCRGQTPINYIEYLVSMFTDKVTDYAIEYMKNVTNTVERYVCEFKRNSQDNEIIVNIRFITSNVSDDKVVYEFESYSPNNNILIDYNLTYDGTIALSVSNSMNTVSSNSNLYIGSDGMIRAKASITKDMFVEGAIDNVLVGKQNHWIDKMSCANNCTMTTFGMPFEIPVGKIFRITNNMLDVAHHSSGRCYVTGIVDKIENNMFTTNFTMIRLPGKGKGVEDIL